MTNRKPLFVATLIATLVSVVGARSAEAQPSLEAYFIGEFAGQYQFRADGERVGDNSDIDLDPTLGAGLRAGITLGVVQLGAMAELRGYGNEQYEDRDFAFDLSPYIGLRVPLTEGDTRLFLRGTVPFGFTVLAPDRTTFGDERYYGFNTGALAGLELRFGVVGIFAEAGIRYHRVYSKVDLGPLSVDRASISWAQFSLNTGLSFTL